MVDKAQASPPHKEAFQLTTPIFIGVDGGATKTHVRVENQAGELLGQGTGGPANIRLSIDKSWESIYSALEQALKLRQIHLEDKKYQFHIAMGLAGCEVKERVKQFTARPHVFATMQLVSDAHTACLGAHAGKDGAIIIVGTGVVGYQIEQGNSTRVAGWGFPHDDEGGGAWLGLQAARLTFHWLDHRAKESPLVQEVFTFFNQDLEHMVAWANSANSSEFARLAPIVIQHAQQKELTAVQLMKKAADAINQIGMNLMNQQQGQQRLPCSLMGGIAAFVEPWLSDALRSSLSPPKTDASQGAISLIREYMRQI